MDYKGLKTGGRAGHTEEKREKEWIDRLKTQGGVGQPKEKRENEWISRG